MECRKFEITLISANDLEIVRKIFKMEVYATVSISGHGSAGKSTPADKHGETNPAWNSTMRFTVSESSIRNLSSMLVVKLFCKRKLKADKYVGEVHVCMKELFERARGESAYLSFPVMKGSVCSQGGLTFSYSFGGKFNVDMATLLDEGFDGCRSTPFRREFPNQRR